MKKNKLIGISVALAGMLVAFGTSIALYTKAANDAIIGFGGYTYIATANGITYSVTSSSSGKIEANNSTAAESGNEGILVFNLGATYQNTLGPSSAALAQDFTKGNLKVEYTVPTGITLETSAYLSDYTATHDAHGTRGAQLFNNHNIDPHNGTGAGGNMVYTADADFNQDITIESAGACKLNVYYKVTHSGTFIDVAEKEIKVKVIFNEPSVKDDVFVTGDGSNWEAWDQYRMVKNLFAKENVDEYTFKGITGFTKAKCRNSDGSVWSSGDDATLTAATTHSAYWNGSGSSAASFK